MVKRGLLVLLVGLTGLLSSCGSKTTPSASGDAGEVKVSQDPVELVFYYPFPQDWDEEKFMSTFGDPIHKKFPYITVKYIVGGTKGNSVPELVAAGQQIDVVAASTGATPGNLMDSNLQYDITPLIKKFNYDLSKLDPAIVDTGKKLADGGMYGLPVLVPPSSIYYNKDIFDKFGVPYPKDGMTWDDMYELVKKLTRKDGDVQYYGFGSSYGHFVLMNQWSLPLVETDTKKSTFDTNEKWKDWVENFVRIYRVPGYESLTPDKMSEPKERDAFFKDRTFAMFMALTALEPSQRLDGMNWDLTTVPVFKDNPVGPQAYPTFFYIASSSQYKDQAFQAISYLTTDEFQMNCAKQGLFVPISSNPEVMKVFGQDNPLYQGKNVQALRPKQYAPAGSVNRYNSMASGKLDIKSIITGKKDVNTALREAAEAVNKTIIDQESGK